MYEFVYKLTLDLNCAKNPPMICSGQFDKGRKFEFTVTANGEPYDVTGCSAVLKGVRTDGSHFAVECTVSDGKIIKTLDDTTLSVRGKTVAKLFISDSEKSYSTQMFVIDVDSALDGDITVADDYSILNRLIEQIHALNESGAIIIDDTINSDSNNAVANKAVAEALAIKANQADTISGYGITDAYTKTLSDMLFGCHSSITFDENYIPLTFVNNTKLMPGDFATGNEKIKYVFISSIVTAIDSGTFAGCTNLNKVFYGGYDKETESFSETIRADAPSVKEIVSLNRSEITDYLVRAIKSINENKVSDKSKINGRELNYPSIKYLDDYYYDFNETNDLLENKADKETTYTKNEVDTALTGKSDKATSLAGYGITDAYTKNDIDSLLNKLGTKNYSFLFDTAGRIFSFTWDNEIKESSFAYQDDTQNGYYVWLGKDVANVASGALQNIENIRKIWCENSEKNVSFATDYDGVAKTFGQNPLSEFYKLASIARLHNEKADKSNSLAGYGIEDAYTKYEVDKKSNDNIQEQINMLPKFLDMPVKVTSRALCVDKTNLYHSGTASYTAGGVKHMYATSKVDVSTEINPLFIEKTGGHDKCYPRNMAIGNGYLYVPYRDSKSGELSSFGAYTDIGGYLDIIRLSDFKLDEENSIVYSREPYVVKQVVDGVEKEVTKYFGKSHFVATYNDSLLCVTQQMGGWKLYDISTNPENPTPLFEYDNRADIYVDNENKKGYADFQQPAFFEDTSGNVYLAISGYDRDLLMIYDLSDPSSPVEVFGFHCGNNQLNLRTVPENGSLTIPYIHTLGLACAYPYIYCTIAPHPSYLNDTEKAFEGVIVADVSDITNVTTTVFKMPNEDRALYDTGEPSPTSIAVNSKHLMMDNADKGISVWSLKNPAEPKYLGCLNTGTPVCSVYMTEDGRTFAGTAVGTKYIGMDSSMTMYRGL